MQGVRGPDVGIHANRAHTASQREIVVLTGRTVGHRRVSEQDIAVEVLVGVEPRFAVGRDEHIGLQRQEAVQADVRSRRVAQRPQLKRRVGTVVGTASVERDTVRDHVVVFRALAQVDLGDGPNQCDRSRILSGRDRVGAAEGHQAC